MSTDPLTADLDRIIAIAQGTEQMKPCDVEHRGSRRATMQGRIAFVQTTNTGGMSIATTLDCVNIGPGGMCVNSRHMLHVGYEGAILMERTGGTPVILGVKVSHCRYAGDMRHEAGLAFTGAAPGFSIDDFRDEQGHLPRLNDCRMAAA